MDNKMTHIKPMLKIFKMLQTALTSIIFTFILTAVGCSQSTNPNNKNNSNENSFISKKSYQQKLTQLLHPYKIDIQQGNVITPEMLEKLHIGMTKPQVKNLLGTSVLSESPTKNQWLYVYNNATAGVTTAEQSLVLAFNQDGLLEDIHEEKIVN